MEKDFMVMVIKVLPKEVMQAESEKLFFSSKEEAEKYLLGRGFYPEQNHPGQFEKIALYEEVATAKILKKRKNGIYKVIK